MNKSDEEQELLVTLKRKGSLNRINLRRSGRCSCEKFHKENDVYIEDRSKEVKPPDDSCF